MLHLFIALLFYHSTLASFPLMHATSAKPSDPLYEELIEAFLDMTMPLNKAPILPQMRNVSIPPTHKLSLVMVLAPRTELVDDQLAHLDGSIKIVSKVWPTIRFEAAVVPSEDISTLRKGKHLVNREFERRLSDTR